MKFSLRIGRLEEAKEEAILVFAWEEGWPVSTEALDRQTAGFLKKEAENRHFEAKWGKILLVPTLGKIPAKTIFLVGLGKKEELDSLMLRQIFAKLAKRLKEEGVTSLALSANFEVEIISTLVEGMLLGSYQFLKYKSQEVKDKGEELEVVFLVKDGNEQVQVREKITQAEIYSQATIFARDLVNEPSSVTTPDYLAKLAEKMGRTGHFSVKVYEKRDIEKLGMGGLLGVSRGSEEEPKFVKLEYRGRGKKIVLVGKGITFDTGGLCLKPQEGMETMKLDMAGAAAILAVFSVLKDLRPKFHLIGLLPLTENMPSGKAIKPGDVIKSYSGKMIEVVNTDAEGRLILADALAFGVQLKPDFMIDLATLTGACIGALGEEIAGLFANDLKLADAFSKAAVEAGEKVWPMPLVKEYRELLKSEVADLKNVTGKKYGGAITASLFLEEFVGKTAWLHLDIAGPAWQEKGTDLVPRGGSGFAVRTILNFLRNF